LLGKKDYVVVVVVVVVVKINLDRKYIVPFL